MLSRPSLHRVAPAHARVDTQESALTMAGVVKYSEAMAGQLAGSVAAGAPISVACRLAGVSRGAYYLWLREHPGFAERMAIAEGKRQQGALERIERKGANDWRADAWLLERTSEDFREQKDLRVHVERGVEEVVTAVRQYMSEGAYGELIGALARLQGVDPPSLGSGDGSQD